MKDKDKKIIANILSNLTDLLSSWGLKPRDWLIADKFFSIPFLEDHPKSSYHTHTHIFINKNKLHWPVNIANGQDLIPPLNSQYLQKYLEFINKFIEIQFFGYDERKFLQLKSDCSLIEINNYKIQQLAIIKQLENLFEPFFKTKEQIENKDYNSIILDADLSLFVYLANLYAIKYGKIELLKYLKKFYDNRVSQVKANIISNKKVNGLVRFYYSNYQLGKIDKNHILVMPYSDNKLIPVMLKAGGVIAEKGGLNSHTAIVCRELGIPAAVGIDNIYNVFRERDYIEINPTEQSVKILKPYKI